MKVAIILIWLFVSNFSLIAQQKIFYRAVDGSLVGAKHLDSIINVKQNKLNMLGFTVNKTITRKTIVGDSIIFDFSLNATNKGAAANSKQYNAMIGKQLPKFNVKDIYGKSVSSEDMIGSPVVINMWFTTCIPCLKEIPELNAIKKKYRNSKVRFIAMTFEKREKVVAFLKKRAFTFIQVADQENYCAVFTNDYPITIFVDKKGMINAIQDGMPMIYDSKNKSFSNKTDPLDFSRALGQINTK